MLSKNIAQILPRLLEVNILYHYRTENASGLICRSWFDKISFHSSHTRDGRRKISMPTKKITQKTTPKESSKKEVVGNDARSMEDLLKNISFTPPKRGRETEGKVVSIGRKQVLFDIGWKSPAVLGELEVKDVFSYFPNLKVGDVMKVKVVVEESKDGFSVVSMRSHFDQGRWEVLMDKYKNDETIEVVCGDYGKGGVFIEFMGVRGVIPKIQLAKENIDAPEKLKGQKVKARILEVDEAKNRLVVSQKALESGVSSSELRTNFDAIKVGDTYEAKVIGFSDFGAFCEVGSVEGLIHISEISWAKISSPQESLKIGDIVKVVVIEKNEVNLKLNLSLKRLTNDPWKEVADQYPADTELDGEVVRRERYGYIVKIADGIEGLVHVSKVGDQDYEVGDKIRVYVERVDVPTRKISLIPITTDKPLIYR